MRQAFFVVVAAAFVALVASLGWMVFGEVQKSEAVEFHESVDMVYHQTTRIDSSLKSTRSFVTTDISEIASIEQLLDEWEPRYQQALLAYDRFDAAIIALEQQAEAYFAEQRALTARFHDAELQAKRQANDERQYALYSQWLSHSHQVRASARKVLNRLEDMNTDLRKLKLTTEMSAAFNVAGFDEVPLEITNLATELSEFQIASENIRTITDAQFEEALSQ